MRITVFVALLVLTVANAAAFIPSSSSPKTSLLSTTELFAVKTGPKGKPASSKDEDLELTRKVILEHIGSVPDEVPLETKKVVVAKEEVEEGEEEQVSGLRKIGRKIKGKIRNKFQDGDDA
uniref:RxLR effector protein n=1 Tax=Helicotheca tamesis TaxID=374047 RepID=A0A7S2I7I5_9STRA|mmetsp:Transcript_6383/g.8629  ORF Transcript_6383/g.8629 Transcript_6383/m.8629 type:complete len:121 (+) Transcript_6383:52-414(+)